jgi:two-component system NarL family sensor kinase
MTKYLVLLLVVASSYCRAQDTRSTDSLLKVLSTSKEDTNKANVLIQLCRETMDMDTKAFEKHAAELLTLSNKINYLTGKADAYNFMGIIEDDRSHYSKALELYEIAMKFAVQAKLEKKKASIENNIGLIYWKIGEQQKALTYYYDALKVFEKLGQKKLQSNVLSNIGLIHASLQDDERALAFHRKSLAIKKEINDEHGIAITYNNMSKTFTHSRMEDSARYYTRLSVAIHEKLGDKYGLAISTANLGLSFVYTKQYDSALLYLNKSVAIRETIDDKLGMIFSLQSLAETYMALKKYDLGIKYAERALNLAEEIKSKERISTVMATLAVLHKRMGNYKKAYECLLIHDNYRDEIFDTLKSEQAEELAVKYEVEKKDLVIQKNRAELKNRQAKIENQSLKLSQRNTQLGLLAIILLGTGMAAYFYYNRNKLRQEARLQQEIITQQDLASKAIMEAEEKERKRIAGDLHDGLGQLCSAIKMNLSGLESQVTFTDKDAAISYEKTIAMTDQACRDVRSISHQMMPNVLLKTGLTSAVRDFLDKIDARILQVSLNTFGLQDRLESNIEMVLYRVIQETVNNVIKHSGANKLDIQLSKDDDGITVTIEDNGIGFDVHDKEKFDGIGLKNIASRVGFLKGTVEFDSSPGRGAVVSVWVPTS